MNKAITIKDPYEIDLGSHAVIEASAGTGKTYTIESLFLRALLEKSPDRLRPLKVDEILAVTFTEKAAGELKERIRRKIHDLLHGTGISDDKKHLLKDALENFDSAHIFTIHGFCQTVLKSYAFENGEAFSLQTEDDEALYGAILKDQMRKKWKAWFGDSLSALLEVSGFSDERSWLDDTVRLAVRYRPECGEKIIPDISDDPRREFATLLCRIKDLFGELADLVGAIDSDAMASSRFNIAYGQLCSQKRRLEPRRDNTILPLLSLLCGYSVCGDLDIRAFSCLMRSRDGQDKKFGYLIDSDMKAAVIDEKLPELPAIVDRLEALRILNLELSAILRVTSVKELKKDVELYKRQRGMMSYEDMLNFVDRALDAGDLLAEELRKRYACAFVDEFQDTDSVQWRIFRRIFITDTNKLFIIGDPKQAIYSFRGADIDAYLEARHEMVEKRKARYYSLATNWRSTQSLIKAFNRLFGKGEWFPEDDIRYVDILEPPKDMRKTLVYHDSTERAAITAVDINMRPADESCHKALAGFIASEISRLLKDGGKSLIISKEGRPSPITAGDICVLIKGRSRSNLIERALREEGVPHSFYKKAGLYNSEEAVHVSYILNAVEDPADEIKFKKALVTPFFGIPPAELYLYSGLAQTNNLKSLFERWYGYAKRRQWPLFFRSLIEETGIYCNKDVTDRRMTNYRQITESLGTEALARNLDIMDLIALLKRYRTQERFDDETFDIERLETEEPRVRIMTIHAAKGLEFPIVFLADGFSDPPLYGPYWKYHGDDHKVIYDLLKTDEGKERLRHEEIRQNRELFYVALTRAKCKLYLPKFSGESHSKGPLAYIIRQALAKGWKDDVQDAEMLRFVDLKGSDIKKEPPLIVHEDPLSAASKKQPPRTGIIVPQPAFLAASSYFHGRKIEIESYSHLKESSHISSGDMGAEARSWITYYDEGGYADKEASDHIVEGVFVKDRLLYDKKDMIIPPGSTAGSMLHEILEEIDFAAVRNTAAADDLLCDENIMALIDRKLRRFGLLTASDQDIRRKETCRIIWNTLNTVLKNPGYPLSSLGASEKITELEFYYPFSGKKNRNAPKMDSRGGFLMGYIDLVFRMGERYYILDWKSNYLEDGYSAKAIDINMELSGYDLQYKVYSVAVVRWLESSIKGFNYDIDFGGIYYIYLRGMNVNNPDEGYVHIRPEDRSKVEQYEKEIYSLVK